MTADEQQRLSQTGQQIKDKIAARNTLRKDVDTLVELRAAVGVPVSLPPVWRAVRRLGMTVKKSPARGGTRPS